MQDGPPRSDSKAGVGEGADALEAAADARAVPRTNLFMAATLHWADASAQVKIRDLSQVGAQIESSLHLETGTAVTLVRGRLRVAGQVTWSNERRCGLQFASQISVHDLMANPAHQAQQRVDHLVAVVKAGAVPLAQPAKPGAETAGELADDLQRIARLLDKLGDALANDATTVAKHGIELQNLDIAVQTLAALAEAAQPDSPAGAAGRARLGELRTSCLEALRSNP